jgi:tetratricopeptide (TPR) repeat protein
VYDWNWTEAERLFRQAIAVNQNYPTAHHWLALNVLVPLRRFQEADDELRHALERDPLSRAVTTSIGMAAYYSDRYTDAIDGFARTLELDDAFPLAHAFLAQACTELGRHDDAVAAAEAAMRLSGAIPKFTQPPRTCTDAPVTPRERAHSSTALPRWRTVDMYRRRCWRRRVSPFPMCRRRSIGWSRPTSSAQRILSGSPSALSSARCDRSRGSALSVNGWDCHRGITRRSYSCEEEWPRLVYKRGQLRTAQTEIPPRKGLVHGLVPQRVRGSSGHRRALPSSRRQLSAQSQVVTYSLAGVETAATSTEGTFVGVAIIPDDFGTLASCG